jgi:hypothetical protein
MKFIFTFKEIKFGSVIIEAPTKPTEEDVLTAIDREEAYYGVVDYYDIALSHTEGSTSKRYRNMEQ